MSTKRVNICKIHMITLSPEVYIDLSSCDSYYSGVGTVVFVISVVCNNKSLDNSFG